MQSPAVWIVIPQGCRNELKTAALCVQTKPMKLNHFYAEIKGINRVFQQFTVSSADQKKKTRGRN